MTGPSDPFYGRARIAGAILLFIAAVFLVLIDSVTDYTVDNITLGLLLGTGSVLLGVEAIMKRLG